MSKRFMAGVKKNTSPEYTDSFSKFSTTLRLRPGRYISLLRRLYHDYLFLDFEDVGIGSSSRWMENGGYQRISPDCYVVYCYEPEFVFEDGGYIFWKRTISGKFLNERVPGHIISALINVQDLRLIYSPLHISSRLEISICANLSLVKFLKFSRNPFLFQIKIC